VIYDANRSQVRVRLGVHTAHVLAWSGARAEAITKAKYEGVPMTGGRAIFQGWGGVFRRVHGAWHTVRLGQTTSKMLRASHGRGRRHIFQV
jgi:hypothetical protein